MPGDFDETTFRTQTNKFGQFLHKSLGDADRRVVDAVASVAAARRWRWRGSCRSRL